MTHSPEFIAAMKQQLLDEKAKLEKELGLEAHQDHGNYEANFPDYGRNDEENATEIADYAATAATVEATEARLKEVNEALSRIEAGTYGVTDDGQDIPEDRLRANPAATTLVTS